MKIGIDARMYSINFTGIGRYVYELIHHLAVIDKESEYIIFMNQPEYDLFKPPNKRWKKVLVSAKHYSLSEQTKFMHALLKEQLDVTHFTHFNAPIGYFGKIVVTIHDLTLSFFPGKKMTSVVHRLAYQTVLKSVTRKAKKIIALSENTKKDLNRLLGIPEEKIVVIYDGVSDAFHKISDEKILNKTRTKYALYKPFLLYTGVWRNHKNIVGLIKAFSILKKKHKFEGFLVITGKEDPFYPEVKSTVTKEGLQKDVIFTGLVEDEELVALYNLAKVFVFPSFYEGFGLPPLEAFSCETPVCASNISAIPEVCGDAALYFNPEKPEDMAEKILKVWRSLNLQKELIKKGLRRVKMFSFRQMAEETLEVYKEVRK